MKRTVWCMGLVVWLAAVGVRADWETNGSYKMHWPQLPDLSVLGMDVNATATNILADDFLCTASGPITNIHIWGSWSGDNFDGSNTVFVLSIHADIPTNESQNFSMPGETLWSATFGPGTYVVRVWRDGIAEGWYDPPTNYIPPGGVGADTICYQYNFPIEIGEAFYQTSGVTYWLDVQASPGDERYRFGWKTTRVDLRWNDDAAFTGGREPNPTGWTPLTYPPGHDMAGETLDLAFVIEGAGAEEVNVLCPKWIQWPDCDIGLDVGSWTVEGETQATVVVADDWYCDGRPINALRWWGSYSGWQTNVPGPVSAPAARPLGFRLRWYTDIPATATNFSQPGTLLQADYYKLSPAGLSNYGEVVEDYYCSSELDFVGSNVYEHEFSYFVQFTNGPWREKEGRIYWLEVEAVYPSVATQYEWGWKTTSPQWHWNDDAVYFSDTQWKEMVYPPPGWFWVTNHPYAGMSADMAFILYSHVCPSRCKKWSQPPDMLTGENEASYRVGETSITLRADDFVSDGRPITDIHWWGSYPGWMNDVPGSDTNPIPPPSDPTNGLLGFQLSWHLDSGCQPGTLLTNIFVPITNCNETFYGSVKQDWIAPGIYEHEYQYYVDLLDPFLDLSPWYETNGVRYWLDIQAVFASNWTPSVYQGWGWKVTEIETGCLSVASSDGGITWTNPVFEVPHPKAGQYYDLSFELTTTNLPVKSNSVIDVVFTNVAATNATYFFMWTTGYCGCGRQVLQVSTNLLGGTWVDVTTNQAPRQENLWIGTPLASQRFYRVLQKP